MLRRRLFIAPVAALLVAGPLVLLPSGVAEARPFCGYTDWCTDSWWQNSNDTGLVGQLVINCGGSSYQWGTETQYETTAEGTCNA